MTQYDNEFFRGPPEGSPTLATDQRPTGAEIFQAKPEKATAAADVPVTREEAPKDPPKKKSNARRITKAIKLLASCMAAVVITDAAVNLAATIEPPPEVPTGQYYAGQWPGVEPSHGGVYRMDMEADMGYSIQMPLEGKTWRLTADQDWRMCWYEGTDSGLNMAYFGLTNQETGVSLMADLSAQPHRTENEEDCYTTITTSTGETLYIRAFFNSLGKYGEEYGLSEEMMAASVQLRQELVEEAFAGIQVTPGTEAGWQGFQIGDKLYSQQSENWYGLGGFGDLEIHIPWVNYAEDYNLQNMTPYSRVNVNGITWSIYFAENDTYLWAVPNINPDICLGGLTARFMCADAVRRGEYINDDEWLEMGGFTSASQRQTAVDILIECLQHHYALRDRWYPRDWPWKGATDDASYWVWAESVKGTWVQFSFGDAAYRVDSTDPELRFHWERTSGTGNDRYADLEISRLSQSEELWAVDVTVRRTEFPYTDDTAYDLTVRATGGETLYLRFESLYHGNNPDFTPIELSDLAKQIVDTLTFQSNPDDSGWSQMLLCDTMYSPQNMEWSGSGIVGSAFEIRYIHTVEGEGLDHERPIGTQSHNGITWKFYHDPGDEEWEETIWAVPDIEPDVCIGFEAINAVNYYRDRYTDLPTYGWDDDFKLPAEDFDHAMEAVSEALAYIYPLGVEPEANEEWYIPDWPTIGQITADHNYHLMSYSKYGTNVQFSFGSDAYRINSTNPHLRFFWNDTYDRDIATVYIDYMVNNKRDWRMEVEIRREEFAEPQQGDPKIDSVIPANDGSYLYLRFSHLWFDNQMDNTYEVFTECVSTVLNAITISEGTADGWGQVWICDLMTTPLGLNWDGNAMVTEEYEIPYFNRAGEQGLWDLEPYAVLEFNGITWTFIYEEADDIIWGLPDFDLRPDSQWCIGAPAKEMAAFAAVVDVDTLDADEYQAAAVEGLSEGLSKYYPRRGFVMEPERLAPDWPSIIPSDDGSDVTFEIDSERNTGGVISLDGYVFEIEFYREDLRFLWDTGKSDFAKLQVYSMHGGTADWGVTMETRMTPFETNARDNTCDRSINMGGGTYMYCRFESWNLNDKPVDVLADEIVNNMSVDYAGKEEFWHTVYLGKTLQTQQNYDWTGLEMVYEDYGFWYVHDAETYDVHQQDYEGQRTINGILWTFRFHKDNDVMYAYPDSEPNLCIGTNPDMMYQWYEAQHGAQQDYFDAIVEGMTVGLQNYYLRPGVEIESVEETGPVTYTPQKSNVVQISLGNRGYCLTSDMDDAWMTWYFTEAHGSVLAAELSMGADCSAQVYISEMPMAMYDNRSHGQIPVESGGALYWYCIEMYDGTDAQLAALMNSLTATGAFDYQWGGVVIGERLYSRQSLSWSGWETVETDGSRTVMMWNLERPANLELGDPIARKKINRINWTLYITEDYSAEHWPFIWAVPDVDPNLAIGSDYENAVYRYYEVNNMTEDFDGDLWSAESKNGAAEVIFEVLQNYYPG